MAETFRLLWTASRAWKNPLLMWRVLDECQIYANDLGKTLVIVHGDAEGGDQVGKLWGQITRSAEEEAHPAAWEGSCRDRCKPGHRRRNRQGAEYCPAAGDYRNEDMIALGADRCAAFIWARSPGASHCAAGAERARIPTRRYTES